MPPTAANHAHERERFVDDLLGYMSIEEKIGQLIMIRDVDPSVSDGREERALLDRLHRGVVTGLLHGGDPARAERMQRVAIEETRLGIPLFFAGDVGRGVNTLMPAPSSAAASWDPDVIEDAEKSIAEQASRLGFNWALGPIAAMTDQNAPEVIADTCGESAWLCGLVTAARIRGLQSASGVMIACLRTSGAQVGSFGSRQTSGRVAERESQMLSYAIDHAGPGSVALGPMSRDQMRQICSASYSSTGEFSGISVDDWLDIARRTGHDASHAPLVGLSPERLRDALEKGLIDADLLDNAVRQVLGTKFDLGLFRHDIAPKSESTPRSGSAPSEDGKAARKLAEKSIILLRNDPAILPLDSGSKELLVVGMAGKDRPLPRGDKSGQPASVIDGFEALGLNFRFVPGLAMRQDGVAHERLIDADRLALGMANEAARRAHTVLIVLGENATRPDSGSLNEASLALIETIQASNDRIVLLSLGPRPIDPLVSGKPLSCVVHAGQLGTMSGHAIASVLTGATAPTARLPYALRSPSGEERLPFGHGLTFTDFALTDFSIELGSDGPVAHATLHNMGDRDGEEMVQIYVRRVDSSSSVEPPPLKGFRRFWLPAQTSERISIAIGAAELGRYSRSGSYEIDHGEYEIRIGRNARTPMSGRIILSKAIVDAVRSLGVGGNADSPFTAPNRNQA